VSSRCGILSTLARFVAELYDSLAHGNTLGEAVSDARKHLANEPERTIAFDPRKLQDWSVPVVWERVPLRLLSKRGLPTENAKTKLTPKSIASELLVGRDLPLRPEIGFYGRDETFYNLDRGFDTNRVVLLYGYAGSGKTATAIEFARWYRLTGGTNGHVLFTNFERHLSLSRLLDQFGNSFANEISAGGVEWAAVVDDEERRKIALKTLMTNPVFWIWDNVEPISGFPAGLPSLWSRHEQRELRDFIAAASAPNMQAKILLTSRRGESKWLGEMPTRIAMVPMPMRESLQLASALALRRGRRLAELPDLRPLLQFAHGNPQTIISAVGQALNDGVDTAERLQAYVTRLYSGKHEFESVETPEARDSSQSASLAYGFAHAFSEEERHMLSLLHLFRAFVSAQVLEWMGAAKAPWSLKTLTEMTRKKWMDLLDRAAEIGQLTSHGEGIYEIHPALPWFYGRMFREHFGSTSADDARKAFAGAMGEYATQLQRIYQSDQGFIDNLRAQEDNFRAAWAIARERGWWDSVVSVMRGLGTLYEATNRSHAFRELVQPVVHDGIDVAAERPRPGFENLYPFIAEWRVRLAMERRDWLEAERLQRALLAFEQQRAELTLKAEPTTWTPRQRDQIDSLATSLDTLGEILRFQGNKQCISAYEEALKLEVQIGDRTSESTTALHLGNAYRSISEIRDLRIAEQFYQQSFNLCAANDGICRATALAQLGQVSIERYRKVTETHKGSETEKVRLLREAFAHYQEALKKVPDGSAGMLGTVHNNLGVIFGELKGQADKALRHYQQAIRYRELFGDRYAAGTSRVNAARLLLSDGKLTDAEAYAKSALRDFIKLTGADDLVRDTQELVRDIARKAKKRTKR
jgi:tetratricopeptide (TPR) repeat protein